MEHALSLGGQRWDLSDGSDSITIGRASNADIRLTADDQISRIHARLARSGSTWTLIDESRNGTALNGRRLAAPTPLTDNDQIHIGRSVLTFHETPSQAAAQPAEAPPASFSPPEPPPAAAYPPPADAPYPAGDAYPAPANEQYAAPADEQYAASSEEQYAAPAEQYSARAEEPYRAPAEDAVSGRADGDYAAPDEASYREDASAYHPDSGEAPAAAPSGPAERPQVVDRFSLAEPVALGDPAAYAPVTPPSSRADRGQNPFAPPEAEPAPSPYAPTAHNQQPSPPEPDQNAHPFTPPDPADRGPSLADRGPRPVTPANRNQQPSPAAPDPGPDPSAYTPAEADRGKNPFAPPEPEQAANPFAPTEGEPTGFPRTDGEPGSFTPSEAGQGASPFAPPEAEPGGFAPPGSEQGRSPFAPAEGEPGGVTPPESEQGRSPFAPDQAAPGGFASESEQGRGPFAAAEGEPRGFATDDSEQGGTPFAPAEGEPGGFAPPESEQGGSPFVAAEGERGGFGPGEGERGGNPFAAGEVEQGVSQFARADGEYESSGDEGSGGVAVGPGDWGAYPSADNPEPARSPWAGGMTVPVQFDRSQASRNESASWPDTSRADEQAGVAPPAGGAQTSRGASGARQTSRTAQPRQASRTTEARAAQAKTRRPADPDEVGQVRLGRVLAVAGALLALGLLINLVVSFFSPGPGGPLRWLVPPVIALITAMVVALMDALSPQERSPGRLNVSVIVAIVVVLLGVGVGGFALTAAAQYAAGYFTGKESGEDRLVKPVGKAFDGLTVTVENVTYTSHFTRVRLGVKNAGDQSVDLPLDSNVALTGPEGNAIRADDSRSQWPGKFPSGGTEHGTITFKGHLPDNLTTATLTLRSGDKPVAVGIALSN